LISRVTPEFWTRFNELPGAIRRIAVRKYRLWRIDPAHPSTQFKRLRSREELWSARITQDYRALAYRDGETITWFWIGSHSDYDQLTS